MRRTNEFALQLLLLTLCPCACITAPADPHLEGWRVANPPALHEVDWGKRWFVSLDGGSVRVADQTYVLQLTEDPPFEIVQGRAEEGLAGDIHAAKVTDGWIVGFNAGEFGAGLWWYSPDGRDRIHISSDQVITYLRSHARLFALSGLDHLGLSYGSIIELVQLDDKRWKSITLAKLRYQPDAAFVADDETIFVVAGDTLVRIRRDGTVSTMVEKAFWRGRRPNSIVVDAEGSVYIGMVGGVASVATNGDKTNVTWLTPK